MVGECRIDRPTRDSHDEEYILAGRLVGTDWVHPDDGIITVESIRQGSTREQGFTMKYPEVQLSNGNRLRVQSFRRKIDPRDYDYYEPAGDVVGSRIVESLHSNSETEATND